MTLTCKEASRLSSDGLDLKLGPLKRLALRLHLALCDGCSEVNAQLRFLRRALAQYPGPESDASDRRE